MMDFLTLTFGNIIGFSNWASKLTKFGAVSQLEDVFYNSFQTCLKEANAKTKGEDEIALNQIELLLRWERKKVISIFKSNALQEISDFRQAMTKSDFIDLLIDNLLKIIEEENSQTIDKVLARKLITNAVENYQNTLFNQISEKQGIYIVLHQVFESQETIEQILINIKRQDEKLDRVHSEVIMDGNSTRIMIDEGFQGIRSMLTDRGMQLESRDWVRKEVLVVEHQKRIEEAILLLKKQDYHESEKTFTNLKEKLILQKLDIENLLYTVNINLGESQERLGKFGMAAKNYIEAYTYNPDSPRAIYLAYIGYKMLNKNDEAEELSQKLKQNYHIELETFVVRLNEKSCIIENIVANLPTTFIGNPELNYAIAKAHLRKGNIKKYKEYMLKAISYSSDNGLLYKPILAYNISHASSSRFHSVKENYLSKAERENLRLAIRLYKEVWEVHRKTKLSKDFIGMPINISTIYSALGMYQKAIEWIDIVLGIKNTAALKSQKIYFLKKWGKKKSVIQICREIDDFAHPDYHDALMIFVEALFNTGIEENQQEAILRLEQFVKKYPDSELINRAKHFLANLYLSTDNLGEMENLLEREPNSISIIALKGRLAFAKKEFERIDKYAEEALNLIDKNTTDTELSELAIALMESQKFTDAAEIFEKFLSPAEPTYLSDCLIHCYKESGNFDKVITHCKQS